MQLPTVEDFQRLEILTRKIEENQKKIVSDNFDQIALTNQEAKLILKCSESTLKRYRDKGLISFTQVGSKILYTKKDINDFLEKFKIKANTY